MKTFGILDKKFAPAETEEIPGESVENNEGSDNETAPESENQEDEEDVEEVEEPQTLGADENTIRQALDLFNKLNNPQTAPAVMAMLNKVVPGGVTKADIAAIQVTDII